MNRKVCLSGLHKTRDKKTGNSSMGKQHKIYISSTYTDLKDYRDAVYRNLRRLGHDVISMEDYVASHKRPTQKCLEDVERCDIYIGIVAWRYGYIPKEGAETKTSITELEYKKAVEKNKKILIFMLDQDVAWSPSFMDSHNKEGKNGLLIAQFRQKLISEHMISFFRDKESLATQVMQSIYVLDQSGDQDLPNLSWDWERSGLADDIHDLINWYHSGVVLWIVALDEWLKRGELSKANELMPELKKHAFTTVSELKELHTSLLRNSSKDESFKQTLLSVISAWSHRALSRDKGNDQIIIECPEKLEIPVGLRNTILRIISLAFSNAVMHSGMQEDPNINVLIKVEQTTDGIFIAIIDNGCGFDPENTSEGFGIDRMRQLTSKIKMGGEIDPTLEIESGINQGTKVFLKIKYLRR